MPYLISFAVFTTIVLASLIAVLNWYELVI
jgi:hypothetical protein